MTEQPSHVYQRGCKITHGARASPPAPSFSLARRLVLEKRASSRIMKPAAATAIQKAFKTRATRRALAVCTIVRKWRGWQVRAQQLTKGQAAIKLQAAVRRQQAERKTRARLRVIAPRLRVIQATWRGALARRNLGKAREASRSIQACWRMNRAKVVGHRLATATARLQAGAVLAKYQKGGLTHERHDKFMWLSKDRQKLCWTDPAASDARCSQSDKSVSLAAISAVSTGVKTALMKKMERRADGAELQRSESIRQRARATVGRSARPLDATCAFSLIGTERVLDLVAPDERAATRWLRDLRTILVFGHHLDHQAAVGAVEAEMRRATSELAAAAAA